VRSALVLIVIAILGLCGCQGGKSGSTSPPGQTAAASSTAGSGDAVFPPRANAAWVYDPRDSQGRLEAGHFVDALNQYNLLADARERIGLVHPYGGDMEMYCPNGDAALCQPADFKLSYALDSLSGALINGLVGSGDQPTGAATLAYATGISAATLGRRPLLAPTIDGVVSGSGYLEGFDDLSPEQAGAFADKVARRMCSDPYVDGVQFDLEPFDVSTRNGQYYFYRRIARDFAGAVAGCKDRNHPGGRFFSVFLPAHDMQPGTAEGRNVADIAAVAGNVYVIDPLYDLSSQPAGTRTPVAGYRQAALDEASRTRQYADALDVPYAFAVPASATYHEYASCTGSACSGGSAPDGQLSYVEAAINAIQAAGARSDALFRGVSVWAWADSVGWSTARFSPATPPAGVLQYLAGTL